MRKTASLFKALSDETRLRILGLLAQGELCVCDLVEVLRLPQSTISRHLAYLRNVGMVKGRRKGVWVYYRIVEDPDPVFRELLCLLSGILGHLDQVQSDTVKLRDLRANRKNSGC